MTCFFNFPFWIFQDGTTTQVEPWIQTVKWTLLQESFFGGTSISKNLREELLSTQDADDDVNWKEEMDDHHDDNDSDSTTTWSILQGVPRRPLYKELAYRLCQWSKRGGTGDQLFFPASRLNMQDEAFLALLPPHKPQNFKHWLQEFGDMGILHVLGKRQTIGTDHLFLVPPSRKALMLAANLPHSPPNPLTVAARARSKHAHRGQDQFFGIASGNQETQNIETRKILVQLLEQAVWINIHTFGGIENPVVEVRVQSGYGARWMVDWSSYSPKNLEFRGFLEPQIKGGHDMKWRHGDKEYMAEQQKKGPKKEIRSIAETPSETTLELPSSTTTDEEQALSEKVTADSSVKQEESEQVDVAEVDEPAPSEPAAAEQVPDPTVQDQTPVTTKKEVKPLLSENQKRKARIQQELTNIIHETERTELEEELEPEALTALKKAAMMVAYRKKYYDVFQDKFIFFPTVTATLMNYALIEEAEKYYFDEDDEFPMDYSAALRSVAGMNAADNKNVDDDADEDYMERLAMDVDIGEDADVHENISDEKIQDVVGKGKEDANQDDKGTDEWIQVGDTGKKSEEKTPTVVPEEKEIPAEAPSLVDITEPEPTALEDEVLIIDEAKSENPETKEDQTATTPEEWSISSEPEPDIEEDWSNSVVVKEEPEPVADDEEPEPVVEDEEPERVEDDKPEPVLEESDQEYVLVEEEEEENDKVVLDPTLEEEVPGQTVTAEEEAPTSDDSDEDYIERLAMDVDIGEEDTGQ